MTYTHLIAFALLFAVILACLAQTARAAGPATPSKIANTIVATWQCQDKIPEPRTHARSPWRHHSPGFRAAELRRWQERWRACTYLLHERARQWNWQQWLPDKWRRIGTCETGLNWFHHNSSYVSAFGIQRGAFDGAYDHDARRVGMPPWNDKRPPSPWQQLQTALSHYAHHGGFSGWGCGAA